MKLLLPILLVITTACQVNHVAKGHVTANTESHVTGEIIFRIDLSGCMELIPEQRLECIIAVTDSIKDISDLAKILICPANSKIDSDCESADNIINKAKDAIDAAK